MEAADDGTGGGRDGADVPADPVAGAGAGGGAAYPEPRGAADGKTTGQVLYAWNEHEQLEPASVTKIMTLLLTMEAIDSGTIGYDDVVTVSAYAAGMGGSQVYLAEGEQITVEELLKAVCVASGNDAAAALAEKLAGVSDRFVEK